MSSPVVFNQSITTDKGTTFKNNTYLYNQDSQPNAPIQIGNMRYTYDKAGNPTSVLDANAVGRDMVWDAENRLKEIIDTKEGLFHSYSYDHSGERILKRYGTAQNAYYNGKDMGTLYDFGESYSAYVSPYFVESNNGYTKHYYAGATRLVSKIGESVYENESYISYGDKEKKQYFYFQDHLGSSTYITDLNGDIAQYSAYTPYGEMFREYRNVTPYRFNGKELDTETGLYYYGARYYNPTTALWLGVDPLASKYPGVSPYAFCFSNPINFIDFNGEEPTAEEAALMAKHVYNDGDADVILNKLKNKGWIVSERDFGISYTNADNGFKSQLYERTIDGKTEYVYAFAVTEDFKDWVQNGFQLIGLSSQYSQSYKNTERVIENIGNNELTLVGHSLGGGLASYSAIKTGNKAITFNAAGVSTLTIGCKNFLDKYTANIDAYILLTDPLNIIQNNTKYLPSNIGDRYYLIPKDWGSFSNGHSIDSIIRSF